MGIVISGTLTYGKPLVASLASLPSVAVSFSQATMDKAYLAWLDVSKLLTTFPEHVTQLGDTVIFKGPVAIVSAMNPTRRLFMQCTPAIVAAVCTYTVIKSNITGEKRVKISTGEKKSLSIDVHSVAAAIGALASGALAFYVAGRCLPTQAGVYFYKQPPFYV